MSDADAEPLWWRTSCPNALRDAIHFALADAVNGQIHLPGFNRLHLALAQHDAALLATDKEGK